MRTDGKIYVQKSKRGLTMGLKAQHESIEFMDLVDDEGLFWNDLTIESLEAEPYLLDDNRQIVYILPSNYMDALNSHKELKLERSKSWTYKQAAEYLGQEVA
jgi:hypothetical protein